MKVMLFLSLLVASAAARDFNVVDLDSGRIIYVQPRGQNVYVTDFGSSRSTVDIPAGQFSPSRKLAEFDSIGR